MNDFINNPDLLVLSGSHLYGYATPESDYDYLGFVRPPIEKEIGLINKFELKSPSQNDLDTGNDTKIYSLKNFIHQLTRNDTQCIEILFAPKENIKNCTNIGQEIINSRNLFLSKQLYKRFSGYAYSEFRKVRGVAIVPKKQTIQEQEIIQHIRDHFKPNKKNMDQILELLYENQPKKEINIYHQLGAKRKESIQKYEYSVKNAAHCIRLLKEGTEILTTGNLIYPFNSDFVSILKDIRSGKKTYKEVEELYAFYQEEFKKSIILSSLPETIDMMKVNQLFLGLTLN
jgi:uncharacterized protein